MIPSATLVPTSSSSAVVTRVDKATSEFLFGPDWTVNIGICDSINSNRWPAKDVVKAVKKRLRHKNPKVQTLALTLLETMVKNCGDSVHFQIVERNILQEMIKIVKKKMDMSVREKILVLLSSWQEAFGGPGGRNPQYYWAYEELRRSGVQFPRHSSDAAALFVPPTAHQTLRHSQAGYGMPSNSSTRFDEAMASGIENLSLSTMNSMWNVLGLLSDMLQAVNPNDCEVVKDEVIVDLVERCRANRKKLMQLLTTTEDEELLGQGIELNDGLQIALAKHDAIASGSPLPTQVTKLTVAQDSSSKAIEARDDRQGPAAIPSLSLVPVSNHQVEEEEEDDFAQLARRHSKMPSANTKSTSSGTSEGVISASISSTSATSAPLTNALVLVPDTPAPVKSTNSRDMIDFLGITLSTAATSPLNPNDPTSSTQSMIQAPFSPTLQAYPYYSPTYPGNQAQVPSNSYVVPWAQPQPQFSSGYPPPPWAVTPGYYRNQNTPSYSLFQGARQLQQLNTFPARGINGSATNGDAPVSSAPAAGHKPFVPSYRLFEDLNVLGSADGRFRTSNTPPSLSGTSSQSLAGSRK